VPLEEVRAVWEVNVFGPLAVYQAMLPLLRASSHARIALEAGREPGQEGGEGGEGAAYRVRVHPGRVVAPDVDGALAHCVGPLDRATDPAFGHDFEGLALDQARDRRYRVAAGTSASSSCSCAVVRLRPPCSARTIRIRAGGISRSGRAAMSLSSPLPTFSMLRTTGGARYEGEHDTPEGP